MSHSTVQSHPTMSFERNSEYIRRMMQWYNDLSSGRNSSGLVEVRNKMCPRGKEFFKKFCGNPTRYLDFLVHIEKENEECKQCKTAFLEHLWSVTRVDGGAHV